MHILRATNWHHSADLRSVACRRLRSIGAAGRRACQMELAFRRLSLLQRLPKQARGRPRKARQPSARAALRAGFAGSCLGLLPQTAGWSPAHSRGVAALCLAAGLCPPHATARLGSLSVAFAPSHACGSPNTPP